MPESRSTSEGGGPFDNVPLGMKIWTVSGWFVVVGLAYWGAHLLGWSLRPRRDARAPLFMLIPTLLYWPAVGIAIWRLRSGRDD